MASTKARVILDIEYDMHPTKYNKVEIEKILAITCHILQRDNLLSWADISVKNYKYKIDLNPRYIQNNNRYNNNNSRYKNNRTNNPNFKKQEEK